MTDATMRAIVEAALDAIITIDADGRIVDFNRAAERMFGRNRDAVVGRELADVIVPETLRERHREALRRIAATGEGRILDRPLEMPALRADGSEFPVELTVTRLTGEGPARYAGFLRDLTHWRAAEAKYRDLVESAPVGIYQTDRDGRIMTANAALARLLGYDRGDELVGRDIHDFYLSREERAALIARYEPVGEVADLDVRWRRKDGSEVRIQLNAQALKDPAGATQQFLGFVRDVTERHDLEDRLRQAQKLDAIGRLAGGVAHDFNNILTAIRGYAEIVLDGMDGADPHRDDIDEIRRAAERAAALTQQLLAFGRKQVLTPRIVDVGGVVRDMEPMLRRLISADIELVTDCEPGLGAVRADPSQLEQVLLNLAVNARDAMPSGGRVTIVSANVDLSRAVSHGRFAVPAGRWITLAVRDTGTGMNAGALEHIFEPFFTTKPSGRGTGLGLATVYGIVRQSGGYVWVNSVPGRGSEFRVYLPRVEGVPEPLAPVRRPGARALPGETVLVAEDEDAVRSLLRRALEGAGFTVLEARDADDALAASERHRGPIHLLLTDVVMPGRSGRELATLLQARRTGLRVLYVSGYPNDAIASRGVLDDDVNLLSKPFGPDDVVARVRDALDA